MPNGRSNRRLSVFDTNPCKRNNTDYFKYLQKELDNDLVKWAFYSYLKTVDCYKSCIDFQTNIPITIAYKEVRLLNAPIHLKWIVSCLKSGVITDKPISELYNDFKTWVKETRESKSDNIMSQTAFGLLLNNTSDANADYGIERMGEKKKSNIMKMNWDFDGLVCGLKKLYLLDSEFEYNIINPPASIASSTNCDETTENEEFVDVDTGELIKRK